MDRRTLLQWGAQLAISLALVAGVIWWSGPSKILDALRSADPRWLAASIPVFLLVTSLHGARWWVLLRPVGRVPLHETILVLFVAKAVGLIIPFRAGAVLQVQLLGRRYELNRAAVAGTLVLEAVIDAACFLVLFILVARMIGGGAYLTIGVWVMAAVVVIALVGIFLAARRGKPAPAPIAGLRGRIERFVDAVREGFHAVHSPGAIGLAVLFTFLDWACATLAFAMIGRGFGLHLRLGTYLLMEIINNLAGAVPFTQSGIGPYEVAAPQMLAQRDVPLDLATAYAVGAHALQIVTALVAGAAALLALRIKPGEVLYLKSEEPDTALAAEAPQPPGETAPSDQAPAELAGRQDLPR